MSQSNRQKTGMQTAVGLAVAGVVIAAVLAARGKPKA
jgi:hypothetical protein